MLTFLSNVKIDIIETVNNEFHSFAPLVAAERTLFIVFLAKPTVHNSQKCADLDHTAAKALNPEEYPFLKQ